MKLNFIKKSFPSLLLGTLAGVFLIATGFSHYQKYPLKSLPSEILPSFSLSDVKITVDAQVMTPDESKRNFGHDLISRGVKPLHFTIQNNTSNEYSICTSSVDLDAISASKVAFKITKSTIPRAIGYKIASFFFWPLMIPSTIDGIRVMVHHKQLKKDILAKSMKDEVLAPYSTFNRVVFVSDSAYQESFKVTLIDLETLDPVEFQITPEQT